MLLILIVCCCWWGLFFGGCCYFFLLCVFFRFLFVFVVFFFFDVDIIFRRVTFKWRNGENNFNILLIVAKKSIPCELAENQNVQWFLFPHSICSQYFCVNSA